MRLPPLSPSSLVSSVAPSNAEQKKLDTQKKYRLHDYTYLNFKTKQSIIKKNTKNKCWSGCGEKGALAHCWWECKLVQLLWKSVWRFLKKLKIELPYDPAIPSLGIYQKTKQNKTKTKALIWKDTCTPMFTAALFTIVKVWKQPKCPSTDEWIRRCGIYTQWNTTQPKKLKKRMKFCHLQLHEWTRRAFC